MKKVRVFIENAVYVFNNFGLVFRYRKDIELLDDMVKTCNLVLFEKSYVEFDISDYNKVTLDIKDRYKGIFSIILKSRLNLINNRVVVIKVLKNNIDKLKRSGKKKFVIDGEVFWERNQKTALRKKYGY